jgi:hypothetical protein
MSIIAIWNGYDWLIYQQEPSAGVNVSDTPADSDVENPISSNWAYDHEQSTNPHPNLVIPNPDLSGYLQIANIDDAPVNNEVNAPISSNWAYDHQSNTTTLHLPDQTDAAGKVLKSNGSEADWADDAGGHTIIDESTPLTQRTKLSFTGAGVEVTDDGNDTTVVTISGANFGSVIDEITYSITDALAVHNGLMRWYIEGIKTISNVIVSVSTAPVGSSIIFDVNKNGTTIFTTQANRPAIAENNYYDFSNIPDVTSLVQGDYLTIDVDQVGSTTAGANAVIRIIFD